MILKVRYILLVGILIVMLAGCVPPYFGSDADDSLPTYIPPAPPGPVTEVDGVTSVLPEPFTGYLTNPGIGWQDGPEPFGFMGVPEMVSYSNRRKIGWSELNPKAGMFDWTALDKQLEQAVQSGKQFSFRVYTFVGEGYDGHMIPEWVLDAGAGFLPSGEPDYSNCVYQEQWGRFIDELRRVYDGNPDIAFIDISGYGDFSEWSWRDEQTEWDTHWEDDYAVDIPSAESIESLDGQARRRLADMFIGGSFQGHSCRMPDGDVVQLDYSYKGFQETQLVMPYAGIAQSTQYVFSRRKDVGFRHDCLGRSIDRVYQKVGNEISQIWQKAPVVFELCKPDEVDLEDIRMMLQISHGSVVHNNNWKYSRQQLEDLMLNVGYRYYLKQAVLDVDNGQIIIQMDWQNTGSAPNYPKMGQDFSLHFYLLDISGEPILDWPMAVDISTWLPLDPSSAEEAVYTVSETIPLPYSVREDDYYAGVSILELRTGLPVNLAFGGRDKNGINILFPVKIK